MWHKGLGVFSLKNPPKSPGIGHSHVKYNDVYLENGDI
jgi:hypothetical protein